MASRITNDFSNSIIQYAFKKSLAKSAFEKKVKRRFYTIGHLKCPM